MSTGNACFTIAPSFSPLNYPGLVAWYNASSAILSDDGVTVLGLHDLSPNANTLVASNGYGSGADLGYLNFSNNTFINTVPLEFGTKSTGLTVFLVLKINRYIPNPIYIPFYNSLTIFTNNNTPPNPIQIGFYYYSSNILNQNINFQDNTPSAGAVIPFIEVGPTYLMNGICFNTEYSKTSPTIDTYYHSSTYINGAFTTYNQIPIVINTTSINTFNIIIGEDSVSKNLEAHGQINFDLFELIIYNKPLSEGDISDINRYLQNEYNTLPLENNGVFTY